MCLYISDPEFSCGLTDGLTEVFHEALADLKTPFHAPLAKKYRSRIRKGSQWFGRSFLDKNVVV